MAIIMVPIALLLALLLALLATPSTASPLTLCTAHVPGFVDLAPSSPSSPSPTIPGPGTSLLFTGANLTDVTGLDMALVRQLYPAAGSIQVRVFPGTTEAMWRTRRGLSGCDMAVGGLEMTVAREKCSKHSCTTPSAADVARGRFHPTDACCLDFTVPYMRTTRGFLARPEAVMVDPMSEISVFLRGASFIHLCCVLLIIIIVAGHLVWAVERWSHHSHFPRAYRGGVGSGVWWAATTITTVG